MKRILNNRNKQKKAEIRRLGKEQLRKMRQKMKREHPGMLENMRDTLEKSKKSAAQKKKTQQPKESAPQLSQDELKIDQAKNIEAVQKMLNLKQGNPGFEKAVKAILSKQD